MSFFSIELIPKGRTNNDIISDYCEAHSFNDQEWTESLTDEIRNHEFPERKRMYRVLKDWIAHADKQNKLSERVYYRRARKHLLQNCF